jgi:hypothetical protein
MTTAINIFLQVSILEDSEAGFGSTEFIVLRAKPGISDKNFVYYLSISHQAAFKPGAAKFSLSWFRISPIIKTKSRHGRFVFMSV